MSSTDVTSSRSRGLHFFAGLPILAVLGWVSVYLSQLPFSKQWGIEYALWAILVGLFVRNTIGLPEWFRSSLRGELFIKIGLVLLGAKVLFSDLTAYGPRSFIQAVLVVVLVFYFAYYLAQRLGIDQKFSHILATAVSICGVSAAIAAAGAVKGDKKHLAFVISTVILVAIPMVIGEPLIGRLLALPEVIAGAWIGGTIDTTPAVAAAGSFYGSDALKIAVIVKMSQNVFIGVTAFLLATYYAFRVERQSEERPSPLEIWFRFPKFILGFIAVSIVASLGLITKPQLAVIGALQNWFFTFAFVCIGLDVALSDYRKIGGRPAVAFLGAQLFNIVVTLVIAWILFGLFSP